MKGHGMDQVAGMKEDSPPLSPEEELSLIRKAQRTKAAFTPLYRLYAHPIYCYLYSRVGQVADAEDLTAQVFLEALNNLSRYRPVGTFAAWLFTIARRRAVDRLRRTRPTVSLEQTDLEDTGPDPLEEAVHRDELRDLRARVAVLTEGERELLRLRYAANLSFADIAHLLDRSEPAVKMQLHRLLRRLAQQMEVDYVQS
jgi:RNA polymerase sigma factor (sigma-70 family)